MEVLSGGNVRDEVVDVTKSIVGHPEPFGDVFLGIDHDAVTVLLSIISIDHFRVVFSFDEIGIVETRLVQALRVADFENGSKDYAYVNGAEACLPTPTPYEAPSVP